ncbi:hypothetical protein H6P81_009503 [Aristolochia fimbriata]|uniref:Uncharacterized protein n=1 Tax=Aristolochia fimbriata TaxID=158543 RepID=A0AAV7EQI3_ARIFI|nr:hypothetical protein H6P81_009503 [Aristolochia fimbriata]
MKGQGNDKRAPPNLLAGVRAVIIRKNSPEALILRRIREYLLFSKLRSLVPPLQFETRAPSPNPNSSEGVMEYEPERDEIPVGDSDEDNAETSTESETTSTRDKASEDAEEEVLFEEEDEKDGTGAEKPFVPSIKIKRTDDALFISTIVLKDVALTSLLFHILEEEKLDIVYENQYRTETKVAHTIQVRVGADYDADALEKKLCIWAGKPL